MRYEFYISKSNIWWNNETENKPSKSYLDGLAIKWTKIDKQIRYTSQTTAELVANDMSIKYVKCVDTTGAIETRYYYVNSFDKETIATIKYNLILDIWVTYIIPMINNNSNMSVSVLRSHIRNKNAFQLNDNLLDSIPITYKTREMQKQEFNYYEFNNRIEYDLGALGTSYRRIINLDKKYIYGGNVAYVFSGGLDDTNDEYIFIPILATPPIFPDNNIGYYGDYKKTLGSPYGVVSFNNNDDIAQAQLDYDKFFNMHSQKVISVNNTSIPNYTKPSDITFSIVKSQWYRVTTAWTYYYSKIDVSIYLNGVFNYNYSKTNEEVLGYPAYPEPDNITFSFQAYTGQAIETFTTIKNDTTSILSLVKKPELIKRFVGIYFIPNIINFYRYIKAGTAGNFQNYLYFSSQAEGLYLDAGILSSFDIQDTPDKYDSIEINNNVILKYHNISYYGNNKQWNYWLVDNQIILAGLFLFSGASNIICNLENHKCKDSIITFPYQLPSSSDGYISYYSGIMSNINNGIKQQEISYNMSLAQQGSNLLSSLLNINKNTSVAGAFNIASSSAFGFANIERQNNAFYSGLKAQFDDVKRTATTNFAASNITDSSYISKYINKGVFAEYLEIWKPDDNSLKLLNNVLYMYGTLYPNTYKFFELFPRTYFNYLQIDNKWLQQWIPSLIRDTQNIKSSVINILASGARVWNVTPATTYEN